LKVSFGLLSEFRRVAAKLRFFFDPAPLRRVPAYHSL